MCVTCNQQPPCVSHAAAPQALLEGGATLELQDALGRTALMFGAGSDATAACNVLLAASASLSARDRRGRAALDYAPAGDEV
jgi:ankyrin repeat protein